MFIDTAPRGCGKRVAGGVYFETPLSPYGQPVENFLVCPPQALAFDAPTQGQLPIWVPDPGGDGHTLHLIDWIGRAFYPNVADFVEEVRAMGLSRRVAPSLLTATTTDPDGQPRRVLEALDERSRLLCMHARALILNMEDYGYGDGWWQCPRERDDHVRGDVMCVGAYWWDIAPGDGVELVGVPAPDTYRAGAEAVWRYMPNFRYRAYSRPQVSAHYAPAIFMALPIAQLGVVRGAHGEHVQPLERIQSLSLTLPWRLCDD